MNVNINPLMPLPTPTAGAPGDASTPSTDSVIAEQPDVVSAGSVPSGVFLPDSVVTGSGDTSAMSLDSAGSVFQPAGMMTSELIRVAQQGEITRKEQVEITPEPMVPEPVVLEQVVSEPMVPEPVVLEPMVPEQVVLEPVVLEPVVPEPVVPIPHPEEPVVMTPPTTKPPEVQHTEPPPPPPTEPVMTVGGTGMGADKTFKMYPSELAALYAIIREKGVVSLEQMAKDLKNYYGIDATVQNGVVVNSSNGHTLIADGNGNGALDMGDINFNTALEAAGIDPADIGKPGAPLLPKFPQETLAGLAFYASGYCKRICEDLAKTGQAAEVPDLPGLRPKAALNDLVKQLKDLMAKEHALMQEAQDLEMTGVPADVAQQSKSRFDEITKEIAGIREQCLPIAQQLGDFIKASKSYLGEASATAGPGAQDAYDEYEASLSQVLTDMRANETVLVEQLKGDPNNADLSQKLQDLRAQIADTDGQLANYKETKANDAAARAT